jgi:serine/threonine protein kinase
VSAPDDLIAGRYRLQEMVGSGGMGAVWRAWDERLHRTVALKQLPLAPSLNPADAELANQRAMREARITARLSHPYAVSVYDVVEHEGRPCIVMQFLPSVALASVLNDVGQLKPEEAIQVGSQVASALAAAHQAGITHRDVKPGNILIADDGTALISDFGISHALGDATLTSTGLIHGTPAFISPEVARGAEATFASDIFSLGSTLYAALEGEPPFGRDPNTIALLHKVAAGEFPPPQHAGPLALLLGQMLSRDPADRPSMKDVATRLGRLAAGQPDPEAVEAPPALPAPALPAPALPAAASSEPPGPPRRRGTRVLAAVVALVTAGVLAGLLWSQYGQPGSVVTHKENSTTLDPTTAASPTSATSTPSQAAGSGQPKASSATPTDPTTKATPSQSPTRTTSQQTSPPRSKSKPTRRPSSRSATDLAQAITSYYALMPRDTDEAWPRMTANYQRDHAGGRSGYESFWRPIARVSASNVTGRPPGRAEATIVYYYKSGRVDTERTAFGLVEQGGMLKISSSTVVSSVSRYP